MPYAIFSDLHDNVDGLYAVLADAQSAGAKQFIYLGDVGRNARLFEELQRRQIDCTFGNWEVSGLHSLPTRLSSWVATWPASIQRGRAIFCHATPAIPKEVSDTSAAARYMKSGVGWQQIFPRLNNNNEAVWQALASLEEQDVEIAFHGHTHIQSVWAWEGQAQGTTRLRSFMGPAKFTLATGTRYLVGVGSAGEPMDGAALRYAIFDEASGQISLRAL